MCVLNNNPKQTSLFFLYLIPSDTHQDEPFSAETTYWYPRYYTKFDSPTRLLYGICNSNSSFNLIFRGPTSLILHACITTSLTMSLYRSISYGYHLHPVRTRSCRGSEGRSMIRVRRPMRIKIRLPHLVILSDFGTTDPSIQPSTP